MNKALKVLGKNYSTIEDFLEDKTFCDWVLNKESSYRRAWEDYAENHPELTEEIKVAGEILWELHEEKKAWDKQGKDKVKEGIEKRLGFRTVDRTVKRDYYTYHRNQYSSHRFSWVIAAVVSLVLVGAGIVGWHEVNRREAALPAPEVAMVIKSNQKGQKSIVHLPDGSQVTLNSSSEIRYLSDFGKHHRNLSLKGEAFFQVARDTSMSFIVRSGEITTKALGTSFNISAYENENTSVKLATGIVEIEQDGEEKEETLMRLIPGEEAFLTAGTKIGKRKFDLESAFLWKDGVLFFDEKPFSDVVEILERWYGVEIILKNKPVGKLPLVSGRFDNDHLDNVLKSIGYSLRFSHEIAQKNVTISFD
ncbi:FecR domain-containing protein [Echinicola marina]|uniref:FecR family protein n=1 Tax=Echinicola marina TaxID=2859768 RepID=UPI001CF71914|nr:FecR domain-containing protein [Echinicola marina]UCS91503.1 FecR domain-containing protein [Echinicola marina]